MQLGLASILTIIFVIAKLAGVISWSWGLVFLPVIIVTSISLLILVVALVGTIIVSSSKY